MAVLLFPIHFLATLAARMTSFYDACAVIAWAVALGLGWFLYIRRRA